MHEIACAHGSCRCTLSDTSPEPFCCDYCGAQRADDGRCACGHDACGGVPGTAKAPARTTAEIEADPALRRQA